MRRGNAELDVSVCMCESTSWMSKRTRDKGVARSSGVSVGLFVVRTRELANEGAEKEGDRKIS